jgi:hypothetical protein
MSTRFHWLRFLVVTLFVAAVGQVIVDRTAPERRFGKPTIAADVEVRVVPRLAPSAAAVRRQALSSESLAAVARRLNVAQSASAAPDEVTVTSAIGLWRRQLAVEVHELGDAERRRVRFVAEGSESTAELTALVEAVAAQYAGDLSAERWYEAVDRLRSAEQQVDTAVAELLAAVERRVAKPTNAAGREGPQLFSTAAEPSVGLEREIARLIEMRAVMLESLQPAHPQVAALDARLNGLRVAAANVAPIRRMAGEAELPPTGPIGEAAPAAPADVGIEQRAVEAAIQKLQAARGDVRIQMDAMLDPSAAEFPVLTTVVTGTNVWNTRPFWYAAICLPALLLGIAAGWPWRRSSAAALPRTVRAPKPVSVVEPTAAAPVQPAAPSPSSRREVPRRETSQPPVPKPEIPLREPVLAETVQRELPSTPVVEEPVSLAPLARVLNTIEDVAAATGAPVAVVTRRVTTAPPRPTMTY